MIERKESSSNSLIDLAHNLPAVGAGPHPPSAAIGVAAMVGVGFFSLAGFSGLLLLFVNPVVGLPLLIVGFVLGLYCIHKQDQVWQQRKSFNRTTISSRPRSTMSVPPDQAAVQVELIRSVKELELAKMNIPAQDRLSERQAKIQLQTTQIQSNAQVEVTRMQSEAQIQSSRWTAMGQAGALNQEWEREKEQRQWKVDQAIEERDWKSSEADKNRSHEMTKLREKLIHELDMWQEKIEADYKHEPVKRQAELDAWELKKATYDAIFTESDEDKRERMLRAFERDMASR